MRRDKREAAQHYEKAAAGGHPLSSEPLLRLKAEGVFEARLAFLRLRSAGVEGFAE